MKKNIILAMGLILILVSSCTAGSRNVVTETREASGFDAVVLEGAGELAITQGDRESLVIEAESNIVRRITSEVKGGTLYIAMRSSLFGWFNVVPTKPIKFDVMMRDIRAVELSGAGTMYASEVTADWLDISVSGAGKVVIRGLTADTVEVEHSGVGKCELSGKVERQQITLSGAGEYDGADLESDQAEMTISGVGAATIWATESLDIELSGAGSVSYYGDPRVSQDVSGIGSVRSLGSR